MEWPSVSAYGPQASGLRRLVAERRPLSLQFTQNEPVLKPQGCVRPRGGKCGRECENVRAPKSPRAQPPSCLQGRRLGNSAKSECVTLTASPTKAEHSSFPKGTAVGFLAGGFGGSTPAWREGATRPPHCHQKPPGPRPQDHCRLVAGISSSRLCLARSSLHDSSRPGTSGAEPAGPDSRSVCGAASWGPVSPHWSVPAPRRWQAG